VEELASRLPKSELGKIIKGALECGKRNAPFTETDLLGSMPPDVLVNYMPLFQVWDAIIETKIAIDHGYASKKKTDKADKTPDHVPDHVGLGGFIPPATAGSASSPQAVVAPLSLDDLGPPLSEDDLNAFAPATSRGATDKVTPKDAKDFKDFGKEPRGGTKSRPRTPPPPPLPGASAKTVEDPSTWSQEFDEDTEFVDAADLLDEEPTINSKGGLGKENTV
jgi:hypothetical protein